jgi:hypothetical protein
MNPRARTSVSVDSSRLQRLGRRYCRGPAQTPTSARNATVQETVVHAGGRSEKTAAALHSPPVSLASAESMRLSRSRIAKAAHQATV